MTATAEVETKTTEQLVAEHERMIIDLQNTIADMAQGRIVVTHESVEAELYAQSQRISEMQQSIEDLMAGSRIETTHQPEIRVRIGHTHTLKDGWRCDSTTVEWTGRGSVDWRSIRDELKNAHVAGLAESEERQSESS